MGNGFGCGYYRYVFEWKEYGLVSLIKGKVLDDDRDEKKAGYDRLNVWG